MRPHKNAMGTSHVRWVKDDTFKVGREKEGRDSLQLYPILLFFAQNTFLVRDLVKIKQKLYEQVLLLVTRIFSVSDVQNKAEQ